MHNLLENNDLHRLMLVHGVPYLLGHDVFVLGPSVKVITTLKFDINTIL